MPALSPIARGEDGFTLVELLVAMTISLVVLLAALQSLDVFASSAAQQTRQTDANDQVRANMDRVVADLRGASQILQAAATDLVYAVPDTSTTSRVERICVSANIVYTSSTVMTTPAVPAGACTTGHKLATLKSNASTTFTYDGATASATPKLVKNVGLTFSLDSSGGGKSGSSILTASAVRRSSGTLPITDADLKVTCPPTGTAGPILSLDANLGLGTLSVVYTDAGGLSLGVASGTTLQIAAGVTSVVATVTDALGVTNTIRRDVTCTT